MILFNFLYRKIISNYKFLLIIIFIFILFCYDSTKSDSFFNIYYHTIKTNDNFISHSVKLKNMNNNRIVFSVIFPKIQKKKIIIIDKNYINENPYKNKHVDNNGLNIIRIGISADKKYTYSVLVLLTSLMENIHFKTKYEIYIILTLETKIHLEPILNSLFEKYGNKTIEYQLFPNKTI